MLYLPPVKHKKQNIVLVYDLRSSLENYYEFALELQKYGSVTIPDLPGLGGMQSFYRIGEKPSLDSLADYLATFVRWRFKRSSLTIIADRFGFAVVTRMLQKYPDISKKVDLLVSLAGYAHKEDLNVSRANRAFLKTMYFAASLRLFYWLFHKVVLRRPVLHPIYSQKYRGLPKNERSTAIKSEIKLWRITDFRTWARLSLAELTLNNCNYSVDLPVWHVWVSRDQQLYNNLVYQHLKVIFNEVNKVKIIRRPTAAKEWGTLLPRQLKVRIGKLAK